MATKPVMRVGVQLTAPFRMLGSAGRARLASPGATLRNEQAFR